MHDWVRTLLVSGCVCALLLYLCPDGKIRGLMESGCACVMLLALISPLSGLDLESYAASVSSFRLELEASEALRTNTAEALTKQVIEQEYAAYILSEASKQRINLIGVTVTAVQNQEGVWLPREAAYTAEGEISDAFKEHITTQLGIPKERQYTYEASGTTE